MRVPGFCVSCRRIRQVDATPMSFVARQPSGTCADCREQADMPFVAVDARGRQLGRAATHDRAAWIGGRRGVVAAVEEHSRRYPFQTVRVLEVEQR